MSVPQCTASFATSDGTFDVQTETNVAHILPVSHSPSTFDPFDPLPVTMIYDPGAPLETEKITCKTSEGTNTMSAPTQSGWSVDFKILHGDELVAQSVYAATDWDFVGIGDLYAEKIFKNSATLSDTFITEETTFTIRHTPDAP